MDIHSLNCKNCGATLDVLDGINHFNCKYCGAINILDGENDTVINAKTKQKQYEHEEKILNQKQEHEKYIVESKKEQDKKTFFRNAILISVSIVLVVSLFVSFFVVAKHKSDKQEQYLQSIVDDIMIDIENGNFEEAYIKANSIHYTENWSEEIETKWDSVRKEVIKQIKKAEREEKGSIFSWFD